MTKQKEKELVVINKIANEIFADWEVIQLYPCTHADRQHFQFAFILRKLAELQYEIEQLKKK